MTVVDVTVEVNIDGNGLVKCGGFDVEVIADGSGLLISSINWLT